MLCVTQYTLPIKSENVKQNRAVPIELIKRQSGERPLGKMLPEQETGIYGGDRTHWPGGVEPFIRCRDVMAMIG